MKCPACSNLMIVVEHDKIELDYCPNCSGVWFDAGELELLVESAQREGDGLSLDSILTSPEAKSAEKRRRCPICARRMKKATLGRKPEVLIDACPRGEGLWFDHDEVNQLITQLPVKSGRADSQEQVIGFLKKVLGAKSESVK